MWLLAPASEDPLDCGLLSIACAGLVVYLRLPNHGSGSLEYQHNVRRATQARKSALLAMASLELNRGTTTWLPETPYPLDSRDLVPSDQAVEV